MSKTKTYLFHELSSYLPLLEGDEFDDLVEDIKQHGQIEPVTIYEGKILDGRNRYRACKILEQELIIREWKPSTATGSTPLQYVISENIMRRHLNDKQKAEIGMLLYPEIEKQVEEERVKKMVETKKEQFGKGELKSLGGREGFATLIKKENSVAKKWKKEDTTAYKVAQKVRVKPDTIIKVKKIRESAYDKSTGEIKDKEIAEKWEEAKREDTSLDAVYKEAVEKEIIEDLPEDLKEEVKREKVKVKEAKEKKITYEPKITVKKAKAIKDLPKDVREAVVHSEAEITVEEAKEIAKIPSEVLRKQEVLERERVKKRQESEIKKKKDLAEGKTLPKVKYFDKDANKVNNVEVICKKAITELTFAGLEGYGESARKTCIEMMKAVFEHLRKELKKAGEVAPRVVIDVDAD